MDECLRRSRLRAARTLGLHTAELMAVARGIYEEWASHGFRNSTFNLASEWLLWLTGWISRSATRRIPLGGGARS